jgi:hypothetical protein
MKKGFLYNNSLTIVFLALFIVTIAAQAITGWVERVQQRIEGR